VNESEAFAREELLKRTWGFGQGTYFLQNGREPLRFFVQVFKDPNRTGNPVETDKLKHMCYS